MQEISPIVVALMKGVVHREDDETLFIHLIEQQMQVRDYVVVLGLDLLLDEAEGYAYLRQREPQEGEVMPPRLVPRRQLSYGVSLLLALLRRRVAEFDARGSDARLVLRREELAELVRMFLPETGNEAKQLDRIDSYIKKVVDLGFLRPLRGEGSQFEVQRILKAFVDAQWLQEFDQRLAAYRAHHLDLGDDA